MKGKARYGDTDGKNKPARKPSGVGGGMDAAFRGYINLQLSADQKAAYEDWSGSASLWEALQGFCSDGVNLSLKLDPRSEGYIASGTQRRESSPNAGLVVTARARDAGTALGRLLFSLTILSHAERWEDMQPIADPDRW
jgi:hypothetical protein